METSKYKPIILLCINTFLSHKKMLIVNNKMEMVTGTKNEIDIKK